MEVENYGAAPEAIGNRDFVRVPADELTGGGDFGVVILRAKAVGISSQARITGRIVEPVNPPLRYILSGFV